MCHSYCCPVTTGKRSLSIKTKAYDIYRYCARAAEVVHNKNIQVVRKELGQAPRGMKSEN